MGSPANPSSAADAWPLAGLRVLDLSSEIAGPYCTKLLCDGGADIIKIEAPGRGDPLRRWSASGTPLAPDADGALFQHLNASKRGSVLDLTNPSDRDTLLALAATADLVVESFAPGTMDALGLGLTALQERNPMLSLVSISPWGGSGPYALRPSTEFTLQAATGSIDYRGLRERKPVAAGGRIGEWAGGVFAAVGALSAVLSARRTGAGQHVDCSLFEVMLLSLTVYHDLNSQWVPGPLARSIEIPSIEPARDGWVGFCTITGQQWKDFCAMLGRQDIGQDDAYLDARLRMERRESMQDMIHSWTRQRTLGEIIELATLMRIPVAPVGNGRTLPEMEQFKARGVFRRGPGGFLLPRPFCQLEKSSLRPPGRAPRLGEHQSQVLAGISAAPPSPSRAEGSSALPFAGLRVIDLTNFWAGPMAGCYLADMGADVVKVESIQRPDGMRFAGAARKEPLWEWSPVFHGANTGKRDVTLSLASEEGMALIRRLLVDADVVIENFSARVLENFGLGWEAVRAINPGIVMVRMPAFGLDGPWRDRAGFAMTVEQVSGMAWITGYPDMPLVPRGCCDPIGGMHAVFALLLALEHRRRTGEGQLVEVPLVEVALNLSAEQVIEYSAYGQLLTRNENRGPVAAPQGVYRCAADGQLLAVAVASDEQWSALVRELGEPAWAVDPALATMAGRRDRHDELDERIEAWLADQSADAAGERLCAAGVPAQRLINGHFLTPHPQLEAREFFQVLKHPITGETRYPGLPMRFSGLPRALHTSPAPCLGQHNEEVLVGELGLSPREVEDLRGNKVIGDWPSFM